MTWWSWIIIWVGLALALVAVLGFSAWWLFRKSLGLLDELGELAGRLEVLAVDDIEHVRPAIAVLQGASVIRAREDARRFHRRERRRLRHDARIARARRITSVDTAATQWPADWYR